MSQSMQYQWGDMLPIVPNAEPTDYHCAKLAARKHSIDTGAIVGLWALTQPVPPIQLEQYGQQRLF